MTKLKLVCFYCGALVSKNNLELDHVPIPKELGGTHTEPCCRACHDMKDRFITDDWPVECSKALMEEFPKLSRFARIYLAKGMRLIMLANSDLKKRVSRAA